MKYSKKLPASFESPQKKLDPQILTTPDFVALRFMLIFILES